MSTSDSQLNPFASPIPIEPVLPDAVERAAALTQPIPFCGKNDRRCAEQIFAREHGVRKLPRFLMTGLALEAIMVASLIFPPPTPLFYRFGGILMFLMVLNGVLCGFGLVALFDRSLNSSTWKYRHAFSFDSQVVGRVGPDWCELNADDTTLHFQSSADVAAVNEFGIAFTLRQAGPSADTVTVSLPAFWFSEPDWWSIENHFRQGRSQPAAKADFPAPANLPPDAIAVRRCSKLREWIFSASEGFAGTTLLLFTWCLTVSAAVTIACIRLQFADYVNASAGGLSDKAFSLFIRRNEYHMIYPLAWCGLVFCGCAAIFSSMLRWLVRSRGKSVTSDRYPIHTWVSNEAIWLQGRLGWMRIPWTDKLTRRNNPAGTGIATAHGWQVFLPHRAFATGQQQVNALNLIDRKFATISKDK